MSSKDREGFIHYSQEELNRIPPFDERDGAGRTAGPNAAGVVGTVGGATLGAGVGSVLGPAGTVVGGVAGAVAGGSLVRAAGRQADGKKPGRG